MFILVAGAGLIGQELLKILAGRNHDVVAVDIDPEVCEKVYSETGVTTINGSATDIGILREAGVEKADVVVCMMRDDSMNIATGLLSKSMGVPRVVARLRNPVYETAYKLAEVGTLVRVADLLLGRLVSEIEQPKAREIMALGRGDAVIYAVEIPPSARSIGMEIRELTMEDDFPEDCVFIGIFQEDRDDFLIPRGRHIFQEGDVVFVVTSREHIRAATDKLTEIE